MLKKLIKATSPQFYKYLQFLKKERKFRRENGGSDYRAKKALVARYGKKVIAGPFLDMAYGDDSNGSAYVPKLIGSYEEELHPVIETIIASDPKVIVDIGCAEGYYAVGLAKRLPAAQVYAYDFDPDAQDFCADLAKLNGVKDRVHIRGLFDAAAMKQLTVQPALIFSDCEGFEAELFDDASVELLKKSDLLIEFHDVFSPGVTQTLLQRFKDTHSIQVVDIQPRDPNNYPCLAVVPEADREVALAEYRGACNWGYFRALDR